MSPFGVIFVIRVDPVSFVLNLVLVGGGGGGLFNVLVQFNFVPT